MTVELLDADGNVATLPARGGPPDSAPCTSARRTGSWPRGPATLHRSRNEPVRAEPRDRIAQMRTRFPALDGLRAIGALAVLTTHVGFHSGESLNGPFAGVLARLDVGVAIFFAISGFLLYRPHVVAWFEGTLPPLTLPYLRNRALRILPGALGRRTARRSAGTAQGRGQLGDVPAARDSHPDLLRRTSGGRADPAVEPRDRGGVLPAAAGAREAPDQVRAADPTQRALASGRPGLLHVARPGVDGRGHCDRSPAGGLWLPGYIGWFAVGMGFALWQVARSSGRLGPSVLDTLTKIPGTVWGIAVALLLLAASPIAGPYNLSAPTPGQAFVKSLLYTGDRGLRGVPGDHPDSTDCRRPGRQGRSRRRRHLVRRFRVPPDRAEPGRADQRVRRCSAAGSPCCSSRRWWCRPRVAAASYYGMERPIMRLGGGTRSYDVSPVGRDSSASAQPNKVDAWTTPEVSPAPPSGQG